MILNINKPAGITSHDVVNRVRRITGEKRVGHGGTLDPFATGVLVVAVGRESTKRLTPLLKNATKEYEATIELGKTSTTGDPEGKIEKTSSIHRVQTLPLTEVEKAVGKFMGETVQTPPAHSAIKIGGIRAYKLARRGIFPTLERRPIKIDALEVVKYHPPLLQIRAVVSSGTYIRKLAEDIGQVLGVGGYLIKLKRTRVGEYGLKDSVSLESLEKKTNNSIQ